MDFAGSKLPLTTGPLCRSPQDVPQLFCSLFSRLLGSRHDFRGISDLVNPNVRVTNLVHEVVLLVQDVIANVRKVCLL